MNRAWEVQPLKPQRQLLPSESRMPKLCRSAGFGDVERDASEDVPISSGCNEGQGAFGQASPPYGLGGASDVEPEEY